MLLQAFGVSTSTIAIVQNEISPTQATSTQAVATSTEATTTPVVGYTPATTQTVTPQPVVTHKSQVSTQISQLQAEVSALQQKVSASASPVVAAVAPPVVVPNTSGEYCLLLPPVSVGDNGPIWDNNGPIRCSNFGSLYDATNAGHTLLVPQECTQSGIMFPAYSTTTDQIICKNIPVDNGPTWVNNGPISQ